MQVIRSPSTATLSAIGEDCATVAWSVVVAYHPARALVGRRVFVDATMPLGRNGTSLGPGVLDDEHISRDHAELRVENDRLIVRDRGSHNGTFVNETRVQQQGLGVGDMFSVGRVLLLVEQADPSLEVEPPDDLPGCSEPYLRVVQTLRRAASRTAPVLLWGDTGTGKTVLGRFVHECRKRDAPIVQLRAASLPRERAAGESMIERARGGSLVLEGIDEADRVVQRYLVDWLDEVASEPKGAPVQVVASSLADPDELVEWGKLRADLLHRFRSWRVRLPPLRERLSDIVVLANTFASRYMGRHAGLDAALTYQLTRHDWPGNVRELEAIVERAAAQSESQRLIRPFPELAQLLRTGTTPAAAVNTAPNKTSGAQRPHVIQREGWSYSTPQGETQDLTGRKTLARVLSVLIKHREQHAGHAVPVHTLLAAAWPDQKVDRRSGANRVYVALTTLRKMGLRELLVRTEQGYMLDPAIPLVIED